MEQEKEEAKQAIRSLDGFRIYDGEPIIATVVQLGFIALVKVLYLIAVTLLKKL